jgi:hypothetical protein
MDNLDTILQPSAETPHPLDRALLDRIAKSLGPNLLPVRPIAPPWLLASGLVLIAVAVATAWAGGLGFFGIRNLSGIQRAFIYSLLALLTWLAAASCVGEMIPGSRRLVSPRFLLGASSLTLLAVFALLFRDYQTIDFLRQGIACLTAGLLTAVPTALAIWFVMRRGFAVNPVNAGMVSGTLAGLAGVTMLELHCPNFEVFHVVLWHTAVILVSAAAGAAMTARLARRKSRPR